MLACDIARTMVNTGEYRIVGGNVKAYFEAILRAKRAATVQAALAVAQHENLVAGEKDLVATSEKVRTDKHVGAGTYGTGSTSLVVKGGEPAIFGWALENGGLSSSVDGTSVTVRVNPYNAVQALFYSRSLAEIRSYAGNAVNKRYVGDSATGAPGFFDLRKLSFGFTFDTTRGRETPQLSISKQQLSSWSARYEFINHRNPLAPEWTARRIQYFKDQEIPGDQIVNATTALFRLPAFKNAFDLMVLKVDEGVAPDKDACARDLNNVLDVVQRNVCLQKAFEVVMAQVDAFPLAELEKEKAVVDSFKTLDDTTEIYRRNREDFIAEVNKGAVATLEYTNHREVDAPNWSTARFIWEKGLLEGFDFTANAEISFFDKKPVLAGVHRVKSFDFALDLERKLNDILPFGNSTFSGALRYTRQDGDVVLPNGVVANGSAGDILFGQVKLTFPLGDSGVKLPLSMTFGNRSEFIREKFTRANFGITFDMDRLFRLGSMFR